MMRHTPQSEPRVGAGRRRRCRRRRGGFSLTEILIVIGLIVLMVALAVPTFNFITGNRSVDGAQNTIGALLGRARVEAIGLQETRGVFFYIDPRTGRVAMVLVRETEPPVPSMADVYLDLVPDSEIVLLPTGVAAQFIDDGGSSTVPAEMHDKYIGFNVRNGSSTDTVARYGGVILFDSRGQLVSRSYAFAVRAGASEYTQLGRLLYNALPAASPTGQQHVVPVTPPTSPKVLKSQFGLVLFDSELFLNQATHTLEDLQVTNPTGVYNGSDEQREEDWIDQNALPLMVNRYNGTLVRGE